MSTHLTFNTRQRNAAGQFEVKLANVNAVILYPALGCPLLLEEPDAPLRFILLADSTAHGLIAPDAPETGGPALQRVINYHLKRQTWAQAMARRSQAVEDDAPLFRDPKMAEQHIRVRYLGNVNDQDGLYWREADGPLLFAHVRPSTLARYAGGRAKLTHLFQVEITGLALQAGELYDLAWIVGGQARSSGADLVYWETQDAETQAYLQDHAKDAARPIPPTLHHPFMIGDDPTFAADASREIQNYHPVWVAPAGLEQLNLGHLTDVHVSSRQHAFRKSRAKLVPGAGDDLSPAIGPMVNASYHALKDLMDQFGQDPDIHVLAFTGDLIDYNRNYHPEEFLRDPEANTGKLWREMTLNNLNSDPQAPKYPYSIDNVLIYSLFLYYLSTYKKPILIISGNHEAYTLPYGISPRVRWEDLKLGTMPRDTPIPDLVDAASAKRDKDWHTRKKKGSQPPLIDVRANGGIPADHNLTIPEAVLMYGPDYNCVILGGFRTGDGAKNFKPENVDWFHTVFSPLTDFVLTFREQCFIGLGWGDDERFIALLDMGNLGGILPRSTEAVSDAQLALIRAALARGKTHNLLLAHFTFANYAPERPIREQGTLNYGRHDGLGEAQSEQTAHNTGTFERNRRAVYELILQGRLRYTLSGHAHRAGLYHPHSPRQDVIETGLSQGIGTLTSDWCALDAQAPGVDGRYADAPTPGLLVGPCGGPIAVQNHRGELLSQGLDYPGGSYLKFQGGQARLGVYRARLPQAKPRFAVALDFADLVGRESSRNKQGVFTRFQSGAQAELRFEVRLNPELGLPGNVRLFERAALTVLEGRRAQSYAFAVTLQGNGIYELTLEEGARARLKSLMGAKGPLSSFPLFLTFHFTDALAAVPGFQHYRFDSPWTYQVELRSLKEEYQAMTADPGLMTFASASGPVGGYDIRRHAKHGEIPDHRFYENTFPAEFSIGASITASTNPRGS